MFCHRNIAEDSELFLASFFLSILINVLIILLLDKNKFKKGFLVNKMPVFHFTNKTTYHIVWRCGLIGKASDSTQTETQNVVRGTPAGSAVQN